MENHFQRVCFELTVFILLIKIGTCLYIHRVVILCCQSCDYLEKAIGCPCRARLDA